MKRGHDTVPWQAAPRPPEPESFGMPWYPPAPEKTHSPSPKRGGQRTQRTSLRGALARCVWWRARAHPPPLAITPQRHRAEQGMGDPWDARRLRPRRTSYRRLSISAEVLAWDRTGAVSLTGAAQGETVSVREYAILSVEVPHAATLCHESVPVAARARVRALNERGRLSQAP